MNTFLWKLAAVLLCYATAVAGQSLPAGTALPVMLNSTLNARSDKPGQRIEGKLMQQVRLADDSVIKKGARVTGHVLAVQKPSRIVLRFDQLQDGHQTIPLDVGLRALAAPDSVFQAGLPAGAAPAEQSDEWVTRQVGGEYVFRGRGYVSSNDNKVGRWDGSGVWGNLGAGDDCPVSGATGQEQALWVFSTTACGAYGFEDLKIANDGGEPSLGEITLESGKVALVHGGSGWLLLVNPAAKNTGNAGR